MSTQNRSEDPAYNVGQGGAGTGAESTAKDQAKSEAKNLSHDAADATRSVGDTAKQEAGNVAHEAANQAQNLVGQLGSDLKSQAGTQQERAAGGLRSLSSELSSMAEKSEQSGPAHHLVQQASQRAGDVAGWLENRDPGSLLDEVKSFARQRPGAFLAIAAGAGLLAGRMARGLKNDSDSGTDASRRQQGTYAAPTLPDVPRSTYADSPAPGSSRGSSVPGGPVTDDLPETTLPTGGSPSFPNPPSSAPSGGPVSRPGGYSETEHRTGPGL